MEEKLSSILNVGRGLFKVFQELQRLPWQSKFPLPPAKVVYDHDVLQNDETKQNGFTSEKDQSFRGNVDNQVAGNITRDTFNGSDNENPSNLLPKEADASQTKVGFQSGNIMNSGEKEQQKSPRVESPTKEMSKTVGEQPQDVPKPHKDSEGSLDVSPKSDSEQVELKYWKTPPRERAVPASPFSRLLGFGSLGMGLVWGAASEATKRIFVGINGESTNQNSTDSLKPSSYSVFLSEANTNRLAATLCRMRGAALKLGQMLSIQDDNLLPPQLVHALERARHNADIMPRHQLLQVLESELGKHWSERIVQFDWNPIAAASIGQVHQATTVEGVPIAMKIQYPGVARSIDSDLENLKRLLKYLNMLPRGMYIDEALQVAKEELKRECDYLLEASHQQRMGKLLEGHPSIVVPFVIPELCTKAILTSQLVKGAIPVDLVATEDQTVRNRVASLILELTLKELFEFRFMQTDPNFSNFLYHPKQEKLYLLDFGASREYSKEFVDLYLNMVWACSERDREGVIEYSKRLGFLTGDESRTMLDAHCAAAFVVGEPFSSHSVYRFKNSDIARRVAEFGRTMLQERLCPPPKEAYSLHRRLSGAYLLCMKLDAKIPCREMFLHVIESSKNGETLCA